MYCRICGGENFKHLIWAGDNRYETTEVDFDIKQCSQCKTAVTTNDDQIVDPREYYPSEYGAFSESKADKRPRIIVKPYRIPHVIFGRLAWTKLVDISPATRVLDVGCGSGTIGNYLKKEFACYVAGVEPSESAARIAAGKGIEVHTGDLDHFHSDEKFDLVILIHVIEHLPDPLHTLKYAHQLLNPGGKLVVACPNVYAIERKVFGRHWDAWDLPRHVHHFSPGSLSYTLKSAGFKVDHVYYEWYSLVSRSLANKIYSHLPYSERKTKCRSRLIGKSMGFIQAVLKGSSAIQIVATRT